MFQSSNHVALWHYLWPSNKGPTAQKATPLAFRGGKNEKWVPWFSGPCGGLFAASSTVHFYRAFNKQSLQLQKANSTLCSQAVSHPSTNRAQCCLTSVIGRELVHSAWYGRWLMFLGSLWQFLALSYLNSHQNQSNSEWNNQIHQKME